MISRRIAIGVACAGAAAAMFASASPALAFPGYTLTTNNPNTANSTTGAISYKATQSTDLTLSGGGTSLTCALASASTASGSVNRGTYSSNTVGSISSTQWGVTQPCTAAGGVSVSVSQVGSWVISVTGASTPTGGPSLNQTTPGSVSNIKANIAVDPAGANCKFSVGGTATNYGSSTSPVTVTGGTVNGSYKNTTPKGTLSVTSGTGDLHVFNAPAAGCVFGQLKSGTALSFGGSYSVAAVSPATDAIWIKS